MNVLRQLISSREGGGMREWQKKRFHEILRLYLGERGLPCQKGSSAATSTME